MRARDLLTATFRNEIHARGFQKCKKKKTLYIIYEIKLLKVQLMRPSEMCVNWYCCCDDI